MVDLELFVVAVEIEVAIGLEVGVVIVEFKPLDATLWETDESVLSTHANDCMEVVNKG